MKYLITSVLLLALNFKTFAKKTPDDQSGGEFKTQTNIYKRLSKSDFLLFSLENFNRLDKRKTQAFGVEYRRKLSSQFFIYAVYEKKYGERFDEDWEKRTEGWFWRDTESRSVDWGFLGGSYRSKWDFLPGKNWKFNVRTGVKYNFHNSQNTLQLNPSLTFFEFKDAKLKRSYFWQTDIFYGANFAKNNIYRWYSYFGAMFHLKRDIAIGGFLGKSFYRWFSTDEIESK